MICEKIPTLVIILSVSFGGLMAQEKAKQEVQKILRNEEKKQIVHQFFSAGCFNKTWEYLDKEKLSEEEIENMIVCANASLYHWKKRKDRTTQNLSIAYWQLARVYTVADKLNMAEDYANKCIDISVESKLSHFYIGYGYEALARAFLKAEKMEQSRKYLDKAYQELDKIDNKDNKNYLKSDLDNMKSDLNKKI